MNRIKLLVLIISLICFTKAYSNDSIPPKGKHGKYQEASANLSHPYTIFKESSTVDLLVAEIDRTRKKIKDSAQVYFFRSIYKDIFPKSKFKASSDDCKNAAFCYLIGLDTSGTEIRFSSFPNDTSHNILKQKAIRMLHDSMDILPLLVFSTNNEMQV